MGVSNDWGRRSSHAARASLSPSARAACCLTRSRSSARRRSHAADRQTTGSAQRGHGESGVTCRALGAGTARTHVPDSRGSSASTPRMPLNVEILRGTPVTPARCARASLKKLLPPATEAAMDARGRGPRVQPAGGKVPCMNAIAPNAPTATGSTMPMPGCVPAPAREEQEIIGKKNAIISHAAMQRLSLSCLMPRP